MVPLSDVMLPPQSAVKKGIRIRGGVLRHTAHKAGFVRSW